MLVKVDGGRAPNGLPVETLIDTDDLTDRQYVHFLDLLAVAKKEESLGAAIKAEKYIEKCVTSGYDPDDVEEED